MDSSNLVAKMDLFEYAVFQKKIKNKASFFVYRIMGIAFDGLDSWTRRQIIYWHHSAYGLPLS